VPSQQYIPAKSVIFVGTRSVRDFDYDDVRMFAKRALEICASEVPNAREIALTVHGVNFGLDETEALYAEIVGLNEVISEGLYPRQLQSLVIVEQNQGRVDRLRRALQSMAGPNGDAPLLASKATRARERLSQSMAAARQSTPKNEVAVFS
jgi:hypothetical protein